MASELDTLLAEIKNFKSWADERVKTGVAPLQEEIKRFQTTLEKTQRDLDAWRRERRTNMDDDGRITIRDGRFAGLNMLELSIVRGILQGRQRSRPDLVKSETLQALEEARQTIRKSLTLDHIFAWENRAIKARRLGLGGEDREHGMALFKQSLLGWRGLMLNEVRKALDSTTAAAGDELVPTLEAAELWMDVNLETKVLPLFIQSPMPSNPFDIPSQLGDLNWYPTDENVSATTTTPTTAKTTLTAKELKGGVPFSDTLEEDAIIALAAELRMSLARNAAEVIDDVLLNGDTTTTNNINADGVTIAKSTAGKAHWLLGFDGLIHLPLIDNTGQRKAHSSTVSAAMFNNNMIKLGRYSAPGHRGDVVHISDINTALTALTISQVETIEKFGPKATISAGELMSIYGIPYIMSEQMKLAGTGGVVADSGGNSKGRVLTVNTTQWRTGFRRAITFEADREAGKSQTVLYVSFRIAFAERTGTRSSASHAALQYDISSVT